MTKLTDVEYDEIVHETEKAFLFNIGGKEVWLPKSVIEVDKDSKTITLPERMATDKEIV
jgi:hypothetical protein